MTQAEVRVIGVDEEKSHMISRDPDEYIYYFILSGESQEHHKWHEYFRKAYKSLTGELINIDYEHPSDTRQYVIIQSEVENLQKELDILKNAVREANKEFKNYLAGQRGLQKEREKDKKIK